MLSRASHGRARLRNPPSLHPEPKLLTLVGISRLGILRITHRPMIVT